MLNVERAGGASIVVSDEPRTTLVRVFQDAVHSARRHGHAGQLNVRRPGGEERVELEVENDGQGVDPSSPRMAAGIALIRERAREIGGKFAAESTSNGGAHLLMAVRFCSPGGS